MELQRGFPLFQQQLAELTRKNATLTWRNKKSAFLLLFSSLFFIFLILCIDKAIKSRMSSTTAYSSVRDPPTFVNLSISPCEDKYFTKLRCYDFVWSGNNSAKVVEIVMTIMKNNPDRPIPDDKIYDMQFELNEVEAGEERNPSTISFLNLLNALIAKETDTSDGGRRELIQIGVRSACWSSLACNIFR